MATAICQNAASVYAKSPARDAAIDSAQTWTHGGTLHVNQITSTDYANYKQYGCGGLKITTLVTVDESDKDNMRDHISKAFHQK